MPTLLSAVWKQWWMAVCSHLLQDESTFKSFPPTWCYTGLILHHLCLVFMVFQVDDQIFTALFVAWPKLLSITEVKQWGAYFPLKIKGLFLPLSDISFQCFSGFFGWQIRLFCFVFDYHVQICFRQYIWADLTHSIFSSSCRQWWSSPISISSIHNLSLIGKPLRILTLF